MTTITVDGLTWYSEDDWKVLVAENARLEAKNAKLKAMIADQINSTGDDPEIMAASRAEWAARAKAAEAKLAKAIKTLEFYGDERNYEGEYYADPCGCCGSWYEPKIHKDGQDSGGYARTTLEQLTGGNDE